MNERYIRQTALPDFGSAAQEKLAQKKLIVFGAGGVGSAALPLLAGAGIGRIVICDGDIVSLNNLHRQTLYAESEIGKPKAALAAKRLRELNSEITVETVERFFSSSEDIYNLLKDKDMCLDATDSFAARIAVSEACANAGVPLVSATAEGFCSQIFTFTNGLKFSDIVCDADAPTEAPHRAAIFAPAAHMAGVWGAAKCITTLAEIEPFIGGQIRSFNFQTAAYSSFTIC